MDFRSPEASAVGGWAVVDGFIHRIPEVGQGGALEDHDVIPGGAGVVVEPVCVVVDERVRGEVAIFKNRVVENTSA